MFGPPQIPELPNSAQDIIEDIRAKYFVMEGQLQEDEALVALYHNRAGEAIQVTHMGWRDSGLIVLVGIGSNGDKCTLFVHPSSFQLTLLRAHAEEEVPKSKIGFFHNEEE